LVDHDFGWSDLNFSTSYFSRGDDHRFDSTPFDLCFGPSSINESSSLIDAGLAERLNVNRFVPSLAPACGWVFCATALGRPSINFELPDWSKTPVENRDLGGGGPMLESFGGNIGVLAGHEAVTVGVQPLQAC
jgi:hypothetical protein